MAWDDRIISKETTSWDGRLPKRNIFSITKVHPGSIAQAAGIEPGQYYYAGEKAGADFWDGLSTRGATGEVVSHIYDTEREELTLLRTIGFPWGMRLEAPHFKVSADLRRALPQPEEFAERIMNAPEPAFREFTEAALRGMARPHPKRLFLYYGYWLFSGHAEANEVIDEMRVPAATGAIAKGDLKRAQKLLPKPTHRLLISRGSGLAGLYLYTAGMIAAKAGKPREETVGLLLGAFESLPDCQRIHDALREFGEPVPPRPKQAGRTFPIDYRLPVVDPRVRVPGPDCPSLTLSQELARLKPHQVALVVVLGGYRTNGFYSRAMEMLGHLHPVIAERLGSVHVITSALGFSDKDRAFTERWMRGETYALQRGVPLVVLTDGEDTVANAVRATHSPAVYVLGPDGSVLTESSLDDDGPIWEALAILDAGSPED
jgi:hypothetical protein